MELIISARNATHIQSIDRAIRSLFYTITLYCRWYTPSVDGDRMAENLRV